MQALGQLTEQSERKRPRPAQQLLQRRDGQIQGPQALGTRQHCLAAPVPRDGAHLADCLPGAEMHQGAIAGLQARLAAAEERVTRLERRLTQLALAQPATEPELRILVRAEVYQRYGFFDRAEVTLVDGLKAAPDSPPLLAAKAELDAARGYRPSWSPDGAAIVLEEGGTLSVVDAATDTLITRVSGRHARWADARTLVYDDTVTTQDLGFEEGRSAYAIDSASLRALDVTTGRVAVLLDDSSFHPRFPAPLPDGSLLFVDTQDGSLWRLAAGVPTLVLAGTAAPRRTAAPPDYGTVATDVPYMHQLWDTPDDFDGGWSCGPTSCVQTISKWGILPNADITTSWPYAHTSHWGWYIPNNYTFNGYTYDTWGVAASSNCQGAHGFVCREYGGAVWDYMVTFLNQQIGRAHV